MVERSDFEFGEGSFVGPIMRDPSFFDLPVREQALFLAWADSCPVAEELTDPNNPDPNRGPEAMLNRYAHVNFWFSYIKREVQERNPELYDQLMMPVRRYLDEPAGKYEIASVPVKYFKEMAPMSTLAGYSLPRLFIEQIGLNKDLDTDTQLERFIQGQETLERSIDKAGTPNDLLALTAEEIVKLGYVEPAEVLRLIMPQGWMGEHNAQRMLDDFKGKLQHLSPTLWQAYYTMPEDQKAQLKIA